MSVVHNVISSPIGTITIVTKNDKLNGVYQEGQSNYPTDQELGERDINDVISAASKQIKEYFAGERAVFDLPLAEADTEFKSAVLATTREIPYGEVSTYGDLADKMGKSRSTIYVAGALNANKLSIVIPCHRVIGMKGNRYVADVANKEFLQKLEASHRAKFSPPAKKKGFFARLLG
jgi:methylated-DNA-[protein]-cysteine S-methyltransferase